MLKRNTSGLQSHVQKKRESALERAESALQRLLKENRTVNFDTVAKEANVSRTWLYQQADIRQRIENLREQQVSTTTKRQESSKASHNNGTTSELQEISALQQRIKKLETENLVLKNHLEVVYGLSDADLIKVIELFQLENEELKGRLQQIQNLLIWSQPEIITNQLRERIIAQKQQTTEELDQLRAKLQSTQKELIECRAEVDTNKSKVTNIEQKRKQPNIINTNDEVSNELKAKFSEVGIKLNAELVKLIHSRPYEQVMNALSVVKENLATSSKVRSKPGLFRKALESAWEPNETDSERETKITKITFAQWYDLALNYGIVMGTKEENGVLMVQETTGAWHKFEDFSSKWTLDYLKRWQSRSK